MAPVSVVRWDATSLPLRDATVDVVLTDMPFGHRHGSHLSNQKTYPRFLRELWRVLVPETGRALLITMARNLVKSALAVQMRKGNWQLRTEKYVRYNTLNIYIYISYQGTRLLTRFCSCLSSRLM